MVDRKATERITKILNNSNERIIQLEKTLIERDEQTETLRKALENIKWVYENNQDEPAYKISHQVLEETK